jgi:hypothetical protein
MRAPAGIALALALAACNMDSSVGYIEIKAFPSSSAVALYLDSVRLDPPRNGNALLRQKVGLSKLQTNGEGGSLALLCTIDVKKNRITSVTVSTASRQPRCQCGRTGGPDAAGNRTCVG